MTSARGGLKKGPFAILTVSVLSIVTAALLLTAFLPLSTAAPAAVSKAAPVETQGVSMEHGMGWQPSPPGDYQKYEIDTTGRQFRAAVDLSAQLPPVGDQGAQDSCVGWSLGYYYKSWQEKQEHTGWDLTQSMYQYSPAFVFNQCTMGGGGIAFAGTSGAFPLLQNEGSTDLQEMPYNAADYTTQPTAAQHQAALPYRIRDNWSYFWTPRGVPPLTGYTTSNDITGLKAQLDAGEPFVIGFPLYTDFPDYGANPPAAYYWAGMLGGPFSRVGGHAMCIVGYNDSVGPGPDPDHLGGFKAVNSWGAGWNGASAGYVYLSYDFVKRYVMEAWQMDDVAPDTAHIDTVTPDHGGDGTTVQIDGYNFGTYRRSARVTVDGTATAVNPANWNDTRIIVTSPTPTTTGPVVVYDWAVVASNAAQFWALPTLTGLDKSSGLVGEVVTLTGSNFGDSRQTGCYVSFGSAQATAYTQWTDTQIKCSVPAAASGQAQVTVTTPGGTTAGQPFSTTPALDAIGPSEGALGTEVTLTGSGFGASRADSYVEFGAVQATQYNAWSESEIKCLVPGDTPGLKAVRVHTAGGDSVALDFALSEAATRWYLAEGSTDGGMETWVLVQNPNDSEVTVDLTLMTGEGEQKPAALQGVAIKGNSRTTFNLNNYVTTFNVSTLVEASGNVVCERAMYGNGRAWAHESIGVTSTSSTWYLAEGCTEGGFETWVLVQNPNDTEVTVTLELQDVTTGGAVIADVPIAAKSRKSFNLGGTLTTWSVSTLVASRGGNVVCERAMYGNGKQWAHDSIGAKATSPTWYLAEGCTAGDFETWVLVQNPGTSPVSVDLQLQTDQGKQAPSGLQGVIIAPATRQSFNLKDYVTTYNVSTMVTSTGGGVVCERAMYGGNRTWAHESIGSTAPAATWYMAEGCTNGGMETWILVQNPNPDPVTVSLTLMTDSGPQYPPRLQDVVIPAESRVSFDLGYYIITYNVSTKVVAMGGGVVCERAMYGNGRQWAHDSAGYAP